MYVYILFNCFYDNDGILIESFEDVGISRDSLLKRVPERYTVYLENSTVPEFKNKDRLDKDDSFFYRIIQSPLLTD